MPRNADQTRARILSAGVAIAESKGLQSVTQDAIAARANVWPSQVIFHFTSMAHLRSLIIRQATERKIMPILVEAILTNHPLAPAKQTRLRREALATIAK